MGHTICLSGAAEGVVGVTAAVVATAGFDLELPTPAAGDEMGATTAFTAEARTAPDVDD